MQVTLKRADFYARAALTAVTNMTIEQTLSISIYHPAFAVKKDAPDDRSLLEQEIANARGKMQSRITQSVDLIKACYVIRAQLAAKNAEVGISDLLTRDKMLTAEETKIRALVQPTFDNGVETSLEAAWAKAEAWRNRQGDRYGENVITIELLNESDREWYRRQLKRISNDRSAIANDLAAANVGSTIDLDAKTVAALSAADLLPSDH